MKKTFLFLTLSIAFLLLFLLLFVSCDKPRIAELEAQVASKESQVQQLEKQLTHLQTTNSSLLDRLSDLSVINKSDSESIQRSLESMTQQYSFIQDLTSKIQSKDSMNLALVMNIKRSLVDINDEDVQVEVKGGLVHVSLSDKLLYRSGSSNLKAEAHEVLEKLATIMNDHDDMNVLIEGHTDDVPIANECITDNWDLSTKRATAIVRLLTEKYYVSPDRLTAAGRSEFIPKTVNDTPAGRSQNRRTEIIITPKLDQFFKLLEAPELVN